ncbi:MAG: hypothetical protein AAFR58_23550, partial [Cyanobacteria bacterium J06627_28]
GCFLMSGVIARELNDYMGHLQLQLLLPIVLPIRFTAHAFISAIAAIFALGRYFRVRLQCVTSGRYFRTGTFAFSKSAVNISPDFRRPM